MNRWTTRQDAGGWTLRIDLDAVARYRRSGAWAGLTVADCARALVERDPDRIGYVAGGRAWRVAELLADAEALAAALAARGFEAGDVVSFQLPNWIEVVVIDLAAAMLGLVVNPIVPIYRDAELSFMLRDCRAKAIFIPGSYRGVDYARMLARLSPDLPDLRLVSTVRAGADPASYEALVGERTALRERPRIDAGGVKMILYTSGTTGRPKGVLHSHDTAGCVLRRAFAHWGQQDGDAVLMASPVTHVTGFGYGAELPLVCGSKTVFMERWSAEEAVALIEDEQVSMSMGATPFLEELLRAAEAAGSRLPSLRLYACGGAAVPPELIRRAWRSLHHCRAFRVFGCSEAPLVSLGFTGADQLELAAATDGEVVDYELRIRDDERRACAAGVEGEICVRGPAQCLGYADPGETAESVDDEGFFATGDLGYLTDGGAIVISGRKKDLINRGGEKISARELEDALHRHPAVAEAAVVAMPHARLGETVCVYATLKPGAQLDFDALIAYVKTLGIARQKYPEHLLVVDALPRTASGKVRKDVLRQSVREIVTRER